MTLARRVAVLVLGDLGRSPRMLYHALALAGDGARVDLVGYGGRPVPREVAEHPRIAVHELPAPLRQRAPRWLFAPAVAGDLVWQSGGLFRLLMGLPRPDVILVQNPPSLPSLPVARLVARLRRARLVVDWHNFGADMIALRLGRGNPAVAAAERLEREFGRGADAHLCVSGAMRDVLAARFGVEGAHVLHDRPARRPGPTPIAVRRRLFAEHGLGVDPEDPGRPPIVASASSWSADEDFDLLRDAMVLLDRAGARVLFVLTGDGPRREAWVAGVAALGLARVTAHTLWVPAEDYPLLLGSADAGVCLHRSASGVDLPMKICDMQGAGLPVCALDYGPVIGEMVHAGEDGLLFRTAGELAAQLGELFAGWPAPGALLGRLRAGVARAQGETWAEGWRREAREVLR